MMRMHFGLKALVCGVGLCLLALTAAAQPPLAISVDDNCQTVLPDFVEGFAEVFPGQTPPWAADSDLDQYPEAGTLAPGTITEEDWTAAVPAPFPAWPSQSMNVYVIETTGTGTVLHIMAVVSDDSSPHILPGAPSLYQQVEATGGIVIIPDFLSRLRPFVADNCSLAGDLTLTQVPAPDSVVVVSTLPAGREVNVTITDQAGNIRTVIARVVAVDAGSARPVITPNEVDPSLREFTGGVCPGGWDCGLIAFWMHRWECGVPFDDPGATAYNPVTGEDLTHLIQMRIVNGHDTTVPGTGFTVRYWIGDEADLGTNGLVERRVFIDDWNSPVMTLGSRDGGPSGAHTIWSNWPASSQPGWEEPQWVQDLRETTNPPNPWVDFLPLFDFVSQPWNDDTAMPWRCWHFEPYEELLDVYDDCEGQFDQSKLDSNVLVVIVKVRMQSAQYQNFEETFHAGGWLGEVRNAGIDLMYGRPSVGQPDPWYGYRIYYFFWDNAGNINYLSRHVNPVAGEGISLAEPTTITISCNGDGLQQLYDAERRDLGYSYCRGVVTHLIRGTGGIDVTPEGYYVPGTYYREYAIEGGQIWPEQWRRTIIVEDTAPDVRIYDELGNEVDDTIVCGCISRQNAIVVPWCEFLSYPGATPQEQADNWADAWWAAQPGYDLTDVGNYGYDATHICESDTTMTAWVDVRGVGVLTNTMLSLYAASDQYHLLGTYWLDYELNHPLHDLARARRPVLLTDDISLDLAFSPLGTEVREEGDRTVVTMQCGAGYPFVPPTIGRIWDNCTGSAITRNIIIDAYELVDGELEALQSPAEIDTTSTGVFILYYGAMYSGSPVPAPVRTVEVRIVDTTPPVLTLLGDEVMELACNAPFVDPGATALDACEGNLTTSIVVSGYPSTPAVGSVGYRIYTVRDSSGNQTSVTRTINVPGLSIVLNGVDSTESHPTYGQVFITEWECNKPYVDPGVASATDECTGASIPVGTIQVTGIPAVIPALGGEFTVIYTLSYGGNTVTVRRIVRILNADGPVIALVGDGVTPVTLLEDSDPEPAWWDDALAEYLAKYPAGPQLPADWEVAEAWDTSLSEPLPWNCDLPAYDDPGASAQDICDASVITDDLLLILTQYNAEEGVEYFRYVGRFGDFATDPPGHAFDEDDPAPMPLNLREDQSRAVWSGYRAYYLAWDTAGNLTVESRLVEPAYLQLSVLPAEITVECGGTVPAATVAAMDLCAATPLVPQRWVWHIDPVTGLEMDGTTPVNYTDAEAAVQPGDYVVVYAATDAFGNSIPALDAFGQPLDPAALVEAGGPYMQQLLVQDTTAPVITLTGGASMQLPFGQAYVEPGYAAADACDGVLTAAVAVTGTVNPSVLGAHPLVYTVFDAANNRGQVTRTVNVVDASQLEITVNPPIITIECGTVYVDSGVTARDNRDGADLTGNMVVSGLVSSLVGPSGARPGTYMITYRVSRVPGGNSASATRTVNVVDSAPPVLTLRGDADMSVDCGSSYRDAGVMAAVDDCDGDLLRRVVQLGNVDTNVPGLHVITFSVKDQFGNEGVVVRNVTVRDNCKSDEGEGEVVFEGELEGEPVSPVQVPDVALQPAADAEAILAAVGLVVGEVTCVCNDEVPQGSVISQDPEPGTIVDSATGVDLVISDGPCSCGCEGFEGLKWANVFLGVLAVIILLIVSLCFGGEIVKF